MSAKRQEYYDADHHLEGIVINRLWGPITYDAESTNPLMMMVDPTNFGPKPTHESLAKDFEDAINHCRSLGATDEEIEESIRLNLRTYNFNDKTFPVDEWMEADNG